MALQNIKKQSTLIPYKPQIDGLRFVAVSVVLIYHYLPVLQSVGSYSNLAILLAFFFVLSSYLITTILLVGKEKAKSPGLTRSDVGIAFLIRRTLRIFPAYYFYLLLLFVLPDWQAYMQDRSGAYLTYLANFMMYREQNFGDVTGHLWTLAVEEQFYIVWPWVVLFTPDKHLRKVLWALVGVGIASRFYLQLHHPGFEAVSYNILTPTCIDSFALGALLALEHHRGKNHTPIYRNLLLVLLPVWVLAGFAEIAMIEAVLTRLLVSLAAVITIAQANRGFPGIMGRFLESKPVLYMAKVSYGIYIYHLLAVFLFWKLVDRLGATVHSRWQWNLDNWYGFFDTAFVSISSYFLLTLLMATASWYVIEQPLNRLKKYFSYSRRKAQAAKKVALTKEVSSHAS